MSLPENHVVAEGRSLRAAIEAAAAMLGVSPSLVEHKLDLAHFRSAQGAGIGSDTVKIFAWSRDPGELAAALAAEAWMKGLLEAMERTGSVRAEARGNAVMLHVDVGEAGRHLVGRGGSNLRAIQYLLERSVGERFPESTFGIDVARAEEDRPPGDEDRGERGPPSDRGERGPDRGDRGPDRGDRGPDRGPDRGDRGAAPDRGERRAAPERRDDRRDDRRGRGGDRRDDRRGPPRGESDRPRRSDSDVEELKHLARKIAERVLETGEGQVIRRELNSFDRRIVHVEIAAIAGVASRSVGEGHDRRIEIYVPEAGSREAESRQE